jgi:hypothetical protein
MMGKEQSQRAIAHLLVAAALGLSSVACGKAAFPKELFTVHAEGADYPVMVSETKGASGRPISASSGTQVSVSQSHYSTGNASVTVTTTRSARSEMPASEKLASQVRRADKWVQIRGAEFEARDFSTYGASSAGRELRIQAEAMK